MKKILLTATMLVGFAAISQAQQGRVGINTTTPAATLDVVANTTLNDRPDALLVPRMTRAQLLAKDAAYVAAQNGALAFVTAIDGTATAKTVNVTATGFYYYDAPNSVWVAVGGGATAAPFRMHLAQAAATSYDWNANSNFDYWEFTTGTQLSLPAPNNPLFVNRKIHIRNQVGGNLTFSGTDGVATPKGMATLSGIAAIELYSNGTFWYIISGRN